MDCQYKCANCNKKSDKLDYRIVAVTGRVCYECSCEYFKQENDKRISGRNNWNQFLSKKIESITSMLNDVSVTEYYDTNYLNSKITKINEELQQINDYSKQIQ